MTIDPPFSGLPPSSSPPDAAAASATATERAVAELRRGRPVVVIGAPQDESLLIQAAETLVDESFARLTRLAGAPARLFVAGRRAEALGLAAAIPAETGAEIILAPSAPLSVETLALLCDPEVDPAPFLAAAQAQARPTAASSAAGAAVALSKASRLLPAAVGATLAHADAKRWARDHDIPSVEAVAVAAHQTASARALRIVTQAQVPLLGAEQARIVVFRPEDGGIEHLAIVVGHPDPDQPVLVRLHSECLTGDLLGSLRCDCGEQLRGAIAAIGAAGSGVLLYLSQEGRGIGLVNKLRAYRLQDAGFDTLEANRQLGFDDDERIYLPAAEMLHRLGLKRIRLMTNNPAKVQALKRCGVVVDERVPHAFAANAHNAAYLRTKATKGGHLFPASPPSPKTP